jgi:DNA-binding NarL/FixJ family response regulator
MGSARDVQSGERYSASEPMIAKPRIVIADPQVLVAEALETLLASECTILTRVTDGPSLLEVVRERHPDVAVVDVALPLLNGLDAARLAKDIDPSLKVVIVTANESRELEVSALQSGAAAYVLKRCASAELLVAIREALQDRIYVTPLVESGISPSSAFLPADLLTDRLTLRQRQVLQLLVQGKSMKEAAHALGITARTVAFHKYRMMSQLRVRSSAELIRVACQGHVV